MYKQSIPDHFSPPTQPEYLAKCRLVSYIDQEIYLI